MTERMGRTGNRKEGNMGQHTYRDFSFKKGGTGAPAIGEHMKLAEAFKAVSEVSPAEHSAAQVIREDGHVVARYRPSQDGVWDEIYRSSHYGHENYLRSGRAYIVATK